MTVCIRGNPGTRLWYPLFDSGGDDPAAFELRVDAICREIGDRGKKAEPRVSEAVPPLAPAAPAATPSIPMRARAPTQDRGSPMAAGDGGGSFAELSAFFREMEATSAAKLEKLEAKLRAKMEGRLAELEARASQELISAEQLRALQARLSKVDKPMHIDTIACTIWGYQWNAAVVSAARPPGARGAAPG